MKIVLVDDPATYSKALETYAINALPQIASCIEDYRQNKPYADDCDIDKLLRCVIEPRLQYDSRFESLFGNILEELDQAWVEGFHNTRLLRRNDLDNAGLRLLEAETFLPWIQEILTELDVSSAVQKCIILKLEQYINGICGERSKMLSFFTPYCISQAYGKYALNIGGEICDRALEHEFPEVLDKLRHHGYPVTVKIRFPYLKVGNWMKDIHTCEFIRYYVAKHLFSYNYSVRFDGALTSAVPAKDILQIVDFIDEWND